MDVVVTVVVVTDAVVTDVVVTDVVVTDVEPHFVVDPVTVVNFAFIIYNIL